MTENIAKSRKTKRRSKIEKSALELIQKKGFDETTVDDIVLAAGIGRRTFFRYFASKNDLLWAKLDATLELMRKSFDACPHDLPVMEAVRRVLIRINTFDPDEQLEHRLRVRLVLEAASLQAYSTLRYADWRAVVAEFVAERTGSSENSLIPQTIAHVSLGIVNAALTIYIQSDDADLPALIDQGVRELFSECIESNDWLNHAVSIPAKK